MHIFITGGRGFVGSALTKFFLKKKYKITILSRDSSDLSDVRIINSTEEISPDEIIDVIINLAGASISKRWSESYKKQLVKSRLDITRDVVSLIKSLKTKPELFISASAIGYYGSQNNEYIDEDSTYIDDFTHELCDLWEKEAAKAEKFGVRTCITRLGVVLGKNGGALKEMLPVFKLAIGGKVGSGKQFFSWVHIDDVVDVFNFLIQDKSQTGKYNLISPNPITNYDFTKELGKTLCRPTIFPLPALVVKMIFGEMGEKLLLNGAAIYPKKLLDSGYSFKFKTIALTLKDILN